MSHDLAQALIDVGGWTLVFVSTVLAAVITLKALEAAYLFCFGLLIRLGVIE